MLKNLKIGKRLGLGFGLVLLLLLAVGFSGYWGMSSVTEKTARMLDTDAEFAQNAAEAHAATLNLRRFEKDMFLNMHSTEKLKEYAENWNKNYEALAVELDFDVGTCPRDVQPEQARRLGRGSGVEAQAIPQRGVLARP